MAIPDASLFHSLSLEAVFVVAVRRPRQLYAAHRASHGRPSGRLTDFAFTAQPPRADTPVSPGSPFAKIDPARAGLGPGKAHPAREGPPPKEEIPSCEEWEICRTRDSRRRRRQLVRLRHVLAADAGLPGVYVLTLKGGGCRRCGRNSRACCRSAR